jgi:hypothetical protein
MGRRFTQINAEKTYLVSIRKPPLPLRERARVKGIKMEALGILNHYHPHPSLPRRCEKIDFQPSPR